MKYNKKSVEPVLYFIFWLVVGFVICLVGISNVFALENPNASSVQLYDNYGSSLSAITTNIDPGNGTNYTYYGSVGLTANSTGAAVGFQSNNLLVKDHMYSLTIYASAGVGSSALSTKNNIGLGSTLSNAVSSYVNSSNVEISYSSTSNDYYYYIIKANITGGYLVVPFNRTSSCSTCTVMFGGYELTDLGDSSDLSQTEVNNIINNQTNVIQNNMAEVEESILANQEKMESSINSNIDDMEQSIVDSNKETQEVIKDQFNSCRDSYNLTSLNNFYIKVADYYFIDKKLLDNFEKNTTYTISFDVDTSIVPFRFSVGYGNGSYQYDLIFKTDLYNGHISLTFTTPDSLDYQDLFIRVPRYYSPVSYTASVSNIMLVKGSVEKDYEPYGKQICTNKIDDTNSKLDDVNETSKGIWGTVKNILSYINPFSENFFAYKLIELLIDGLKKLIVPENFDFINDFKDVLENKLGFIASVPLQLLDYILSLKDKMFTPMNTISFPSISIFGYYFWDDITIDITEGLSWVSSIKYFTDLGCVILMVNTLRKWYANFTGGAEN